MRLSVINENELVEYFSIQNRDQMIKEMPQVFYRMAVLKIWPGKHF